MTKRKVVINPQRIFTEAFKRERVKEYEQGSYSVPELSKLFKISGALIYNWIYKYSTYNKKSCILVEMKDSSTLRVKGLECRIKELEQIVGQKQIEMDYLEKLISIAETDLGVDIKKNSNTPQSTGLGQINRP